MTAKWRLGQERPSLKGFGLTGNRGRARHWLRDDQILWNEWSDHCTGSSEKGEAIWSGERRPHGGWIPDGTPGLKVGGEDWERHSEHELEDKQCIGTRKRRGGEMVHVDN